MDADDPAYPRFTVFDDASCDPLADTDRDPDDRPAPTRGVGWVLRWSAVLTILVASLVILADFAYTLWAEQTVARAARAAALEATLPRASYQTVAATAEGRLLGLIGHADDWQVFLAQNGTPVYGPLHPQAGDRLSVTLAVSSRAALPRWLRVLGAWRSDDPIEAQATRRIPGPGLARTLREP